MQSDPTIQQFMLEDVHTTGRVLGTGAYGSVHELEFHGLLCAGKRIHDVLLEGSELEQDNVAATFARECALLSSLRHPHVVQFLGLCVLPGSALPVLVMEYLPTSLDDCLSDRESDARMPLPLKRSVLHDTARGLAYLHMREKPIIHRDVTARNILLNANMQAKLADLGVARMVDFSRHSSGMTAGPGTFAYMPPEAMGTKPRYDSSLDIFSFGVLALYTITESFPEPEAPTTIDGSGRVIALTEVQRRSAYFQALQLELGSDHSFELLVANCLENKPVKRPNVKQVLQHLDELKTLIPDPFGGLTRLELIQQLGTMEKDNARISESLWQSEVKLNALRTKLDQIDEEKRSSIPAGAVNVYTSLERPGGRRSKVKKSERSGHVRSLSIPEKLAMALSDSFQKLRSTPPTTPVEKCPQEGATAKVPPIELRWRRSVRAPFKTSNTATVIADEVCVTASRLPYVASFSAKSRRWQQFRCPVEGACIVTFNGTVTLVGGREVTDPTRKATNEIAVWAPEKHNWVYPYPPMQESRCYAAAVSYRERLLVAGGWKYVKGKVERHNSVEVLDASAAQWVFVDPLPVSSMYEMTSMILSDQWYLLGGSVGSHPSKVVLSASLPALLSQSQASSLAGVDAASPPFAEPEAKSTWRAVQSTPLRKSSAIVLNGNLVAAGGIDDKGKDSSSVWMYTPDTDSWQQVAELPSPRSECACVLMSTGELLVTSPDDKSRTVDIASVGSLLD